MPEQINQEPEFARPLSVEEARTVELSMNPIKRLGQIAELGARFGMRKAGWSPFPLYMTRGDLIRSAEAHEYAVDLVSRFRAADERDS